MFELESWRVGFYIVWQILYGTYVIHLLVVVVLLIIIDHAKGSNNSGKRGRISIDKKRQEP